MSDNFILTGEASLSSWNRVLEDLPDHLKDSYYNWEYIYLYEVPGQSTPMLFVYKDGGHIYIMAFLKHKITSILGRSLSNPIFDIETPYGYGGPISTTNDCNFIANANSAFLGWVKDNEITAEFVRFHPILRTKEFAGFNMFVERNKTTYSITIDKQITALDHFRGTARNRVKGALKNGILSYEVSIEEGMKSFQKLYFASMQRLQADNFYKFSGEYFERLTRMPKDQLRMLVTSDDEDFLSMAIFLKGKKGMHYHLGANSERRGHSGSFNLLMHHATEIGLKEELNWIHLGGGRLSDGSDSLSHFKRTISNTTHDYFIGRRVHHMENWKAAHAQLNSENSFQKTMPRFLEYHFHP
jgi:hypothetical protein